MNTQPRPRLRFGMIADVQYADYDDREAWYNPAKTRFYRNSLRQVQKAFAHWESFGDQEEERVDFILQLGDIIDALNTESCSQTAINRTLSAFLTNSRMPTFHTVGNHELYNFSRLDLSRLFHQFMFTQYDHTHNYNLHHPSSTSECGAYPLYYSFTPRKGIRLISLDMYEISVLGLDRQHLNYQLAANLLETYHGHRDPVRWDSDDGLVGADRRFQSSNGALSDTQLEWLEVELDTADAAGETVLVFGHTGLHPNSCGWDSVLWNYQQVIDCFNRHHSVVAYFNGHAHNAGYALEEGVHYITLHGVIETAPEVDAFTTVTVFDDHICVDGRGVELQLRLDMRQIKDKTNETNGANKQAEVIVETNEHFEDVHVREIEIKV